MLMETLAIRNYAAKVRDTGMREQLKQEFGQYGNVKCFSMAAEDIPVGSFDGSRDHANVSLMDANGKEVELKFLRRLKFRMLPFVPITIIGFKSDTSYRETTQQFVERIKLTVAAVADRLGIQFKEGPPPKPWEVPASPL